MLKGTVGQSTPSARASNTSSGSKVNYRLGRRDIRRMEIVF
jgi:hypothetical protein